MKSSGKTIHAQDTIPYIVCIDGTGNSPVLVKVRYEALSLSQAQCHRQRAYHPEELAKSKTMTIDINYYLKNQIHPVVSRLIEPIEGTDNAHV